MQLAELNLLPEDEQQRLIALGKGAELPFAMDSTIAEVFRERASASPDALAVVSESSSLTYRQLDEWSDRVAGELAGSYGIEPDQIAALCFSRSIEMIVAIVAVWKGGPTGCSSTWVGTIRRSRSGGFGSSSPRSSP